MASLNDQWERLCVLANYIQTRDFQDVDIPIFISEYSNTARQPRQFRETKAIYAPSLSRVFSGGCVYEYYQGFNGYGLVGVLDQGRDPMNEAWRRMLARTDNPSMVADRRASGERLLLIYRGFVNYKASLAAIEAPYSPNKSHPGPEEQPMGNGFVETERSTWLREPEFAEPRTCIDWDRIGKEVKEKVASTQPKTFGV